MDTLDRSRHLPLEGSFNIRDLGGYPTQSGSETRFGRVFRADSLHCLTPQSQQALLGAGVRVVIDLRTAGELQAGPNPFTDHPDVKYQHVSLFEPLYLKGNLGGGNRADIDLPTLYRLALEHAQEPIKVVLEAIAQTEEPVLFHCTAGKDRTGIIAALLLALAGVTSKDIVVDYAATTEYVRPLMDHLRQEAQAKGHDLAQYNKLLQSEPEFMQEMLDYLEEKYGGVEDFLMTIGLDAPVLRKLKSRLE